jgi:hypothetical protein
VNLEINSVLILDLSSSQPLAPGSFELSVLLGKVAFFTALGTPDNGIFGTPTRDIVPLNFRGKQSKDGWSSCRSCHPEGWPMGSPGSLARGRSTAGSAFRPITGGQRTREVSDAAILAFQAR